MNQSDHSAVIEFYLLATFSWRKKVILGINTNSQRFGYFVKNFKLTEAGEFPLRKEQTNLSEHLVGIYPWKENCYVTAGCSNSKFMGSVVDRTSLAELRSTLQNEQSMTCYGMKIWKDICIIANQSDRIYFFGLGTSEGRIKEFSDKFYLGTDSYRPAGLNCSRSMHLQHDFLYLALRNHSLVRVNLSQLDPITLQFPCSDEEAVQTLYQNEESSSIHDFYVGHKQVVAFVYGHLVVVDKKTFKVSKFGTNHPFRNIAGSDNFVFGAFEFTIALLKIGRKSLKELSSIEMKEFGNQRRLITIGTFKKNQFLLSTYDNPPAIVIYAALNFKLKFVVNCKLNQKSTFNRILGVYIDEERNRIIVTQEGRDSKVLNMSY